MSRVARWLLAAGMGCAHGAFAGEAPIARLAEMEGHVLVANRSSMATADEGDRLPEGSRVLTTARAAVTIVYDDGCRVRVAPGQRVEVDRARCTTPGVSRPVQAVHAAAAVRP